MKRKFGVDTAAMTDAEWVEADKFGFIWGNVYVQRLVHFTPFKTTYRCVAVKTQRHEVTVYCTEKRGDVRIYLDGRELK